MSNTSPAPAKRRLRIGLIVVAALLVVATSLAFFIHTWNEKSKVAYCRMNLRNYNCMLAGVICTSSAPTETWADPDAVIAFVKEKQQQDLPVCPDGGSYSLIYEPGSPNMPVLVCSMEKSHGHGIPRQ